MTKMSETFSIYLERRMARILLLGMISGFPWVLIGSSLSLWLKEDGLSRSTIGWAGLIFGVYAFNFLWAPLIDRLRVPYLTPRLGHRRAWIVTLQALIALMFVPEQSPEDRVADQLEQDNIIASNLALSGQKGRVVAWLVGTVVGPLVSFFRRNGFAIALAILGFVFLFKIGEAFLGRMSIVFYKEMGFSKSDIALYSKGIGWITTVVFTLIGGLFAIRIGLVRGMFVSGILMAATNLMFSWLAWSGRSEVLFATAVLLDDLAGAFATVTFVAFISMLVDRTYTATQYALLASIGTAGRTLFASSSGALVDWLDGDWGKFFVLTAVMVIPSLVCLWILRHKLADMLSGAQVRLFGKSA